MQLLDGYYEVSLSGRGTISRSSCKGWKQYTATPQHNKIVIQTTFSLGTTGTTEAFSDLFLGQSNFVVFGQRCGSGICVHFLDCFEV